MRYEKDCLYRSGNCEAAVQAEDWLKWFVRGKMRGV